MKKYKTCFLLFICAIIVTFGCIVGLQFTPIPWFFIVLVCMHGGIVLFIISKKKFIKKGFVSAKKYYIREYIMLAFYIPIIIYKILSRTGLYTVNENLKLIIVAIITLASVVISIITSVKLYKAIKTEENNDK